MGIERYALLRCDKCGVTVWIEWEGMFKEVVDRAEKRAWTFDPISSGAGLRYTGFKAMCPPCSRKRARVEALEQRLEDELA